MTIENETKLCPDHPGSGIYPRVIKALHESKEWLCCTACCMPLNPTARSQRMLIPSEHPIVRSFAHFRLLVERTDEKDRFPLEYWAGCCCEEAGEVYKLVKKVVYQGHPFTNETREKIIEELGDLLTNVDRCAERIGVTLEEVALKSDIKRRKRYPDGFSPERSIHREDTEQEVTKTCPTMFRADSPKPSPDTRRDKDWFKHVPPRDRDQTDWLQYILKYISDLKNSLEFKYIMVAKDIYDDLKRRAPECLNQEMLYLEIADKIITLRDDFSPGTMLPK